jgi:L-2-hydroxyglutarate oxidase LhgO
MNMDFDCVVIGAGVIGLAIARELALSGQSVLVIEKSSRAGTETSSRNSEVIHAGIYYPTGSLKAQLCVEGRKLLYGYCAANNITTRRLGKLIVATYPEEVAKLNTIKALAEANGVDDLALLSAADVASIEPEISCTNALISPSTGIVDAHGFMLSLEADASAMAAIFAYCSHFIAAHKEDEGFVVFAEDQSGERSELKCSFIFNCAGHGAHDVARGVSDFPAHKLPPRYLAKGSYCSVSGKNPFQHLIYPVPVSGALGIHATIDLNGTMRLGPDIEWTDAVDYTLPDCLPEKFTDAVGRYWPGVRARAIAPSYCGIRPKIHGPEANFADFMIQEDCHHGISGLVNLFGIESPGLTASLSIAKHATQNYKNNRFDDKEKRTWAGM